MSSLIERLGHPPGTRALIINCDELGLCHAANVGVYAALREGTATSASLMVPGPWARDAAARYRGEDVGVHLTVNSEHDTYRWGPITHGPSLLDGDGGFPRTRDDLWDHGDIDEVRRECRAQLERAILWGFDVSHLNSHLGTMDLRPEFFDILMELATEFGLPVRLGSASTQRLVGFPFRDLAAAEGVLFPDHLLAVPASGARRVLERALGELEPGVTEVQVCPAIDTAELRAAVSDWPRRVDDHDLVAATSSLRSLAARAGVVFVGYRAIRDLQRAA